jgi:hypothetical protein
MGSEDEIGDDSLDESRLASMTQRYTLADSLGSEESS